ncbi:hypothetical protein H0O02_00735 [Candidatus Micrarchaeota archaeon]|nr:hypothetical protein [Candidatus Micrarchaeota archaeon]
MAKNAGKIIVTVHSDIVWKAASVRLVRRRRRKLYSGNLDNVVCVAEVLRSVMPRVKDRHTKFYFTGGEETTMSGAKAVMKREGRALYIPIDVTNASRKSDINIEWPHNIDRKALKKMLGGIPRLKVGFKTGHEDETHVFGKKYPAFSLNLPVEGHMHGRSRIPFLKARRFGRAVAEILRGVRLNYDKICMKKRA